MINLLKNEFIKTYKKKGILIMFFVIIGYIILTNLIYKGLDNMEQEIPKIRFTEVSKEDYDLTSKKELEQYIDEKSMADVYNLQDKYKEDSWQYAYLNDTSFYDYYYVFNSYEYNLVDKDTYDLTKKEYDEVIKYLDNNDWKSIVQKENNEIKEQISTLSADDEITRKRFNVDLEVNQMRLDKNIPYGTDYKNINLNLYLNSKRNLMAYEGKKIDELEKYDYYEIKQSYLSSQYNIKNDIDDTKIYSNFEVFKEFITEYSLMILIFIFMVASGITSQEFNKGTIKLLLVKPYTRTKILLSKYIVSLCSIFIIFIIVFIVQLIVGSIILDVETLSNPVLIYSSVKDSLQIYNIFEYALLQFLAYLPKFILLNTIVFALSTITTSTSFAMILGFVVYLGSNVFEVLITMFNDAIKGLLYFSHWNLSPYIFNNEPIISGCNIFISILVIIIYVIIILVTSIIIFKKKDIKNI